MSGGIFASQTKETWESTTLAILNKFGESLLEVVARDTCDGPCISRVCLLLPVLICVLLPKFYSNVATVTVML